MFRQISLLTLITLLFPLLILSQRLKSYTYFSTVDSFSRTIKYKNDIYRMTNDLTKPYSEQLLKVRAIFVWITDNIRFDYKFYNKGKEVETPNCKPGMNCEQLLFEWENKYLKKVIKNGKGVCDGYSRLFKKMCEIAGIKSEIISGYTKTKPYQVGNTGSVNHAWNAVWLDSAYYLLDATWAAGGCPEDEATGKLLSFQKRFDNYYWLTPFNEFTRNHYPQNGKWVLEPNYTKEKFAANPYYAPDIISKIKLKTPESGIINTQKGDTIHFQFEYTGSFRRLQINSNVFQNPSVWVLKNITKSKKVLKEDTLAFKKQQYISYKRDGDKYEFEYVVTDNSLYYLEILFDYRRVMRFKVNIARQDL
ncbi:MAG: transglutaminase domain-containing protein [Chitinophagaceae bacterium]